MPSLPFTVDSALLRELGDRLVGQPHIAIAELAKNSYDADATEVTITLDLTRDLIAVNDDGHGMTFEEFKDYWMRIASTHKVGRLSKKYQRRMTGSKGVGRLAVQFLARNLTISTCSDETPDEVLTATINWDEAIKKGTLTEVEIDYERGPSEENEQGTLIILENLVKKKWTTKEVTDLARKLWWLQPPFRGLTKKTDPASRFEIKFISHGELVEAFETQMRAILDIWHARIVGRNVDGDVSITIEWAGEKPRSFRYKIENCMINEVDFEIRIFHLIKRQPRGIMVKKAREYFREYGGVHLYDGGFRLPHYGDPKNDWLRIQLDHSRRITSSELLPEIIQKGVKRGMQYLPTLSRIFGVVNVNTAKEEHLKILVTRDRFLETEAFDDLCKTVRYSLDLYALWERKRSIGAEKAARRTVEYRAKKLEEVLEDYQEVMPKEMHSELSRDVMEAVKSSQTEAEVIAEQVGLVGSLATAGITSLAYQHETKRLLREINRAIDRIRGIETLTRNAKLRGELKGLREDLEEWMKRSESTNALFTHLSEPENLDLRKRFQAKKVIDGIKRQMSVLMKGVSIMTNQIDTELYFPEASLVEWSAIFQNVFLNAYNAMLASKRRRLHVNSRSRGFSREILVQDTGYGVNLKSSDRLFGPFVRETKLPDNLKAAGYGGTGLGLTIVRMLARNIGCAVSFVKPDKGFKTAFSLKWRESE